MIYYEKNNLIIRDMLAKDVDEFFRKFTLQGWKKQKHVFETYYNEKVNEVRNVIVAEIDGDTAGYITLIKSTEKGPFCGKNIPEIRDFNVFKKFQHQGIGNKLMDVIEIIAGKICTHVSIAVGLHSGYGTAQRLYVKRGYIPDGTGVWHNGKIGTPYNTLINDDDLVLYFIKDLSEK